jgi:uncharacterized protein
LERLQAHWQACSDEIHLVTNTRHGLIEPPVLVPEQPGGTVVWNNTRPNLVADDDDISRRGAQGSEEIVTLMMPARQVGDFGTGGPEAIGYPQRQAIDQHQTDGDFSQRLTQMNRLLPHSPVWGTLTAVSGDARRHFRIRLGAGDQHADIGGALTGPAQREGALAGAGAPDEQRSHERRIGVYVEGAATTEARSMTPEERNWGMLAHLSAFAFFICPFGNVIGPLIVWLVKRDQSPFVADQGREALNFNISVLLAGLVCGVLVLVFIGILLGVVLFVFWLVMTIVAGIRASEGVQYRYPFTLRLVK